MKYNVLYDKDFIISCYLLHSNAYNTKYNFSDQNSDKN